MNKELKRIRSILSYPTGLEDDDQEYIEDARKAIAALIEQQPADDPEELRQTLANILCRIHRDGGHYIAEHGWRKAIQDADLKVAQMNADADTRPQSAAWVGLTDEEIDSVFDGVTEEKPMWWRRYARAVEAKLRERNGGGV